MEAMGVAQNQKKEEKNRAARGEGSKSVQMGPGAGSTTRDSGGTVEDESALLGEPPHLKHGRRRRERNENRRSLECVAHDGTVLESKSKVQV